MSHYYYSLFSNNNGFLEYKYFFNEIYFITARFIKLSDIDYKVIIELVMT